MHVLHPELVSDGGFGLAAVGSREPVWGVWDGWWRRFAGRWDSGFSCGWD